MDPEDILGACVRAVVPPGEHVLLAVSGGSDSMALLGAAARVLGSRATVVHVDHGLRASSERDADQVHAASRGAGLDCDVVRAHPTPADPGTSETACRARRLAALETVAARRGAPWIFTAHHLDDALETQLLHLLRGHRGDRARAAIPTVRRLAGGPRLVRPFLFGVRPPDRAALAAYRSDRGLGHVDDPTNRDARIPRNAVRRLLGEDRAPLARTALAARRRAARQRLQQRLLLSAASLEQTLRPQGLGATLDRAALAPPEQLGACLRRPRHLAPRAGVLAALESRLDGDGGELALPALPTPVVLRITADAVQLPHDPPADGDPAARVLAGLGRTPLYL